MKTVKRKNFAKTTAVRRDSLVIVIRFELSPGGKGCGFLFKRTGVRLPYYRGKNSIKPVIYDGVRAHARTLPAAAQGERIGPPKQSSTKKNDEYSTSSSNPAAELPEAMKGPSSRQETNLTLSQRSDTVKHQSDPRRRNMKSKFGAGALMLVLILMLTLM